MRKNLLIILLLFASVNIYAQSISYYDLTNLTSLSAGEAHNYLTLGKTFKHQYLEETNGKRIEHFRSIGTNIKEQTITVGVNTILKNGTVLRTVTYTTVDPQHMVNLISQAKRGKMVMKFQGADANNNIYMFDNDFYHVDMYISTNGGNGTVKINQKEFYGY
jgi:hypothetical protein